MKKKIISSYGYKSIREIYKDTIFLDILISNEILYITPTHQDGLGSFTTLIDKSGKSAQFEYNINLTDEKLGEAVIEAFKYYTSIYQKKK